MLINSFPGKGAKRYRRTEASRYLKEVWSIDATPRTLAKWACLQSNGPAMEYCGRFPLYAEESLDAWARARISPPVTSTSARQKQQRSAA